MKLHRKFEINSPNHNAKKTGWKTKEAILSDKPREKLYSPPVSPVGGLINDYIIYFFGDKHERYNRTFLQNTAQTCLVLYIYLFLYKPMEWKELTMQSFHCPITIAFHVLHWYVHRLVPPFAKNHQKFT